MTQSAVASWVHYSTDGGTAAFAFPFFISVASEIEALLNGSIATNYVVSGIGVATGGTVTFFSPPATGQTLFLRRNTPQTQNLDLVDHDPFSAAAVEGAWDKDVRLIQEVYEQLSRRPQLAQTVLSTLRNLVFPTPLPLKLWGWNATADGITYYDPAIVTITVDPASGKAEGKTTTTVNASTGAGTALLTAAAAVPAGVLLDAVTARVTVTCGDSNGLTTFSVGDIQIGDRWGVGIARTSPTVSNAGQFRAYAPIPIASALDILLLADAGLWDATGTIKITCHWRTYAPDA